LLRPLSTALILALTSLAGSAYAQTQGGEGKPDVERGRYLYIAGGCASCHAAPATSKCDDVKIADEFKPIGGRCLKTGFGTFNVPNITPDKTSGLGNWTAEDFIKAMTKGTAPSGANLYPAFPYTSYQRMTRGDLLDLWAFLQSLEPISSNVANHDLKFPYNIRAGLFFWKKIYLDGKTFKPDPTKSDKINRGAYLVQGPGHCGECHTPRSFLGGMSKSKPLSGAPNPEGKGTIPNITPDETGIGSWSEKDIVYALETGFTPDGDSLGSTMAEVQSNMAKLTKEDREAIAAYLKSIPPIKSEKAEPKTASE
jgi:mono/diheme cytochrome c family protein